MEMSILIFTMGHHYLLLSWSSVLYGYKFFPNENLTLFLSSLSFVVLLLTNLNSQTLEFALLWLLSLSTFLVMCYAYAQEKLIGLI